MPFTDILSANSEYPERHKPLPNGRAAKELAIVTCIDTRIDPADAFGLSPGDAKILRNAGARVTDDVLRTLVMATTLLGVKRIALIAHTDCAAAKTSQEAIEAAVHDYTGADASDIDFFSGGDQIETLHADAEKIRECPLIPEDVLVAEFIFDVQTGRLAEV